MMLALAKIFICIYDKVEQKKNFFYKIRIVTRNITLKVSEPPLDLK